MISVTNYQDNIKQVNLAKLPKVYQDGHEFFMEAKDWYNKDKTVQESIDLYLQKLNQQLSCTKPKTEKGAYFINSFLGLHTKTINKRLLGNYISSLQKAIAAKQITKSSIYARHIQKIQEKLISQYNKLEGNKKIKIFINKEWKAELQRAITSSELNGLSGLAVSRKAHLPATNTGKRSLSIFDSMNDINTAPSESSFRLAGDLGKLLGDLEMFELAITLEGDQGGGKTRFGYQLADAFAGLNNQVAIFSLEIGRRSDLIRRMREEYVTPANRGKIFITDQLPDSFETIRKAAKEFDVVVIDSWNKLNAHSSEFDKLRKDFPDTIFIVIFQRTTQGTIRGGTAPLYDASINLEVVKVDDSFKNNYAVATKNRYGETGIQYNIYSKRLINSEPLKQEDNE
ncbi:antirestriction protein [Marivirga lumbricoides]|uniref:Antirestriction protein n=1 Tax=Marivirga lumbricoides TaxID=1046115 RepID=A0A2T4DWA2_9BACT|nr:antirestriction protein [Marivirga lumbricoides]